MSISTEQRASQADAGAILTKAVVHAAERLDVTAKSLAAVLGVSQATLSRMKKGVFTLEVNTKSLELGVLFVRLFRSLDASDEAVAHSWLNNPKIALDGRPAEKIRTVAGLVDVIAYLDAGRAVV